MLRRFPLTALEGSRLKQIDLHPTQISAYDALKDAYGEDGNRLAPISAGAYIKKEERVVASLRNQLDPEGKGRIFFHELAHAMEHKYIDAPEWQEAYEKEWKGLPKITGPNEAFGWGIDGYMTGGDKFRELKPLTVKALQKFGF